MNLLAISCYAFHIAIPDFSVLKTFESFSAIANSGSLNSSEHFFKMDTINFNVLILLIILILLISVPSWWRSYQ